MYKKIICVGLLTVAATAHGIVFGPNIIANSPSDYLVNLGTMMNNPEITKQIGNELFIRDYTTTVSTHDQIVACFNQRPVAPGAGSSFDDGNWVWIPDSLDANTGIWFWVLKNMHSLFEMLYHMTTVV
jgi:hypothetical protein